MSDGRDVTFSDCQKPKLTIGLLGVELPDWILERGFGVPEAGYMRDMRFDEIERRILLIEAALARIEARQGGDVEQAPREAREPEKAPTKSSRGRVQ